MERNRRKLFWVRKLGAEEVLHPNQKLSAVRAAFDFAGSAATLRLSLHVLEPGGILLQVGAAGARSPSGFERVHPKRTSPTPSGDPSRNCREVVELTRAGRLRWHVKPLPLERVNEALDRVRRGRVLGRLVLVP